MNLIFVWKAFLLAVFSSTIAQAQIAGFYPHADTLNIAGGCTPPIIYASISEAPADFDTIKISPGWNTHIWIRHSIGNEEYFDKVYFLVKDSLESYTYKLWLIHETPNLNSPICVPFDSTFEFWARVFDLKLKVFKENACIDSLVQNFIAIIGVGLMSERQSKVIPRFYKLWQNFPNPFNPATEIRYNLPAGGSNRLVSLIVYDVLGRQVKALIEERQPAGMHKIIWDGTDMLGKRVPSGVYISILRTGDFTMSRKMILMK
ncbi:T9SS type A sorting domain-containing protein [candidate division KSB1 bacterium]|nr:T9SS type A sorting domain-containing protein [candidate division KSB1 bacterium]